MLTATNHVAPLTTSPSLSEAAQPAQPQWQPANSPEISSPPTEDLQDQPMTATSIITDHEAQATGVNKVCHVVQPGTRQPNFTAA